jgi:hypothetical protein
MITCANPEPTEYDEALITIGASIFWDRGGITNIEQGILNNEQGMRNIE